MVIHFCAMAKEITSNTTIKELLEEDRDAVTDALIKFNRNFSKLRNPLLRNLMSRRITIGDACKIAGCTLHDFMSIMTDLGFITNAQTADMQPDTSCVFPIEKEGNFIELDVRPLLASNIDPLKTILAAVNDLKYEEGLKIINTFEPVPLIHLLVDKGFAYTIAKPDAETVVTYFNRIVPGSTIKIDPPDRDAIRSIESFEDTLNRFGQDAVKYIDVRNLEMPGPMITILENLHELNEGCALFVYHKKRPVFLLPELEKMGYKYLFKDIADGNVNMLIFKS